MDGNGSSLWIDVANRCLERAKELLEKETAPTCEEIGAATSLINAAVSMDQMDLQWEAQNRSGAALWTGRASRRTSQGS